MASTAPSDQTTLFAVPRPIRKLFEQFPLQVYAAEPLPVRAPEQVRARAKLHVFSTEEDALRGLPSYNPTCLKWQTYLRIANVQTDLVPSTNHASPSGALPYLLPVSSDSRADIPLTGNRIAQYAQKHSSSKMSEEQRSPRQEAYLALLAQNIRPAWLHALYINPIHTALLSKLYLPSSPFLRLPLLQTLRDAATAEILKTTRRESIDAPQLYRDAEAAFRALSTLLGDEEWFSGGDKPRLFDAEVFAYTYLIADEGFGWSDCALGSCLGGFGNLNGHRKRLFERCWGNGDE